MNSKNVIQLSLVNGKYYYTGIFIPKKIQEALK